MLMQHSIHPATIYDEAKWNGYYMMPNDPGRAAKAGRNIVVLVRLRILERVWGSRRMTDAELLAGYGAGRTIGVRPAR